MVKEHTFSKVKHIVKGGDTRFHSSLVAIQTQQQPYANILIHDAARPAISAKLIKNTIKSLEQNTAVVCAVRAKDTIISVNKNIISEVLDRSKLYHVQTPQAFDINLIRHAYALASEKNDFLASDDSGVFRKYCHNESIFVLEGEQENIKITHKTDIPIIEKILSSK